METHDGQEGFCINPAISDADVLDAMRELRGYIDITPGDFRKLYLMAFDHAVRRIAKSKIASDVMTANVISVGPDAPLNEVASLMAANSVSGVPVVDAGRVAGVISEKDFMRHFSPEGGQSTFMRIVSECLNGGRCLAAPVRRLKASELMTSPAVTVRPDAPAIDVASMLSKMRINRAPVVDGEGRLMGIITRSDLIQGLGAPRGADL